jgi:hypothetical protein
MLTISLEGHRHNPYVGSFHTVDRRTKSSSSSMLLDSSLKNPFIGTVRHSPAGPSAGLKGLLWEVHSRQFLMFYVAVAVFLYGMKTNPILRDNF